MGEPSGSTLKESVLKSPEFESGFESKREGKKEDDDDKLFMNFEIKTRIAVGIKSFARKLFRTKLHQEYHSLLLSRGVMNHRTVDFSFLDSISISVRKHFEKLGMEAFCLQSSPVYPELTAYFYSNLSILFPNRISFSIFERKYDLNASQLADIIGVKSWNFIPINVPPVEAYKVIFENPDFT